MGMTDFSRRLLALIGNNFILKEKMSVSIRWKSLQNWQPMLDF